MHSPASLAVVHSHLTGRGQIGPDLLRPRYDSSSWVLQCHPVTPGEYAPVACQERPLRRLDTMHVVHTRSWEAIPTLGTRKLPLMVNW